MSSTPKHENFFHLFIVNIFINFPCSLEKLLLVFITPKTLNFGQQAIIILLEQRFEKTTFLFKEASNDVDKLLTNLFAEVVFELIENSHKLLKFCEILSNVSPLAFS
jgi:hypothetical protein